MFFLKFVVKVCYSVNVVLCVDTVCLFVKLIQSVIKKGIYLIPYDILYIFFCHTIVSVYAFIEFTMSSYN
jgi:hypothetical protein